MAEYIDCVSLVKWIKTQINPYGKPTEKNAYEFGLDAIRYIENVPTADVQEVKHGEWKPFAYNINGRTCSNCHISQSVTVYNGKVMFKYCPYCGAKMDGGKSG